MSDGCICNKKSSELNISETNKAKCHKYPITKIISELFHVSKDQQCLHNAFR